MEYTSLKVPELRKLLGERSLPVTGNKADLVARLQEDDKKKVASEAQPAEDEIDYSDDDVAITTKHPEPAIEAEKPQTAKADAPVESVKEAEASNADAAVPAESANGEVNAETIPADDAAAEKFALNLPPTSAEDEAKKRAERAKRFGLVEDDEERKKADRAKKFGIDTSSLAKSLDSALPDRPLKRGRAREDDGGDGNKRQSNNRRDNRRQGRGRGGRFNNRGGGGGGGRSQGSSILSDPTEKAKAEARAKRFGSG
ncbi:hypothetical protein jhhlp_002790 [Lomentospora prolificans]|uniref:SAP domain-containing protein n=1 Tax=Lomentospora prolificans TaxID=41688 RepID=A0A2N3NF07_9PEZI|nr:hypothetical protein jhhlp_002790 [Lomentospora prolificans]